MAGAELRCGFSGFVKNRNGTKRAVFDDFASLHQNDRRAVVMVVSWNNAILGDCGTFSTLSAGQAPAEAYVVARTVMVAAHAAT